MTALAQGDGFAEKKDEPASIDELLKIATFPKPPADAETAAVVKADLEATEHDIPIPQNSRIYAYVELFQGRLRDYIQESLTRGTKYLPMIQSVFRAEGLPLDLAYIPIIESGFKTNALSKANAKGPWQFMKATAEEQGLKHDWYIDERSDPEKATLAAAKYLKTLHKMFNGDWHLVLAAYNGGLGRLQRAMKSARHRRLLGSCPRRRAILPKETREYVPLILAAIIVAKNPAQYGFDVAAGGADRRTRRSLVPRAIDLRRVAEWTGQTIDEIQALNPELRRWTTPVETPNYEIKVPAGTAATFATPAGGGIARRARVAQVATRCGAASRSPRSHASSASAAPIWRKPTSCRFAPRFAPARSSDPARADTSARGERLAPGSAGRGRVAVDQRRRRRCRPHDASASAHADVPESSAATRCRRSRGCSTRRSPRSGAGTGSHGNHIAPGDRLKILASRQRRRASRSDELRLVATPDDSARRRSSRSSAPAPRAADPSAHLPFPTRSRDSAVRTAFASGRACWHACGPPRSSASRPVRSRSKSTCRSACRPSGWSDCRTPACARAATACAARSATPASSFRLTASPSTSAPADIRKAGSSFDLPIALGILAATGLVKRRDIADIVLLGELSLDGGIQPARGVLPVAAAARRDRFAGLLLPLRNAAEASVVEGLRLLPGPVAHRSGCRAERP